jgi:ATP-dependent Lhr-like helicase
VRVAGEQRWAAIEDAGRLRDALGVALPTGIPVAFTELLPDPLGDLVARFARTHGPFSATAVAQRYGLGVAVVTGALHRMAADGRAVEGEFIPQLTGPQWCDANVLRLLRRRCLARLRKEAEPVPPQVLAAFLPAWQSAKRGVAETGGQAASRPAGRRRPTGPDAVYSVVEQLAGAAVPAAALESLILPARVDGYGPAMLDELTAAGEVVWSGAGALPGGDGWLVLAPAASASLLFPPPGEITSTPVHDAVLAVLDGGGALFFRGLADRVATMLTADQADRDDAARPAGTDWQAAPAGHGLARPSGQASSIRAPGDQEVAAAIWDLVWAGLLTNDTLAPLRTLLGTGRTWTPAPRPGNAVADRGQFAAGRHGRAVGARRPSFGRAVMPSHAGPPTVSGRWSALPPAETDQTRRLHARALALLDRHGVLIRGAVATERVPGGFGALYPVLRAMEDGGQCRRGYFVEGLGAAQFALPGAVDRMRAMADSVTGAITDPTPASAWPASVAPDLHVLVLAAADPANAYGAALAWPARPDETPGGHRPGRKAGALVVLVSGQLVLYVERGGKTLLSWTSDPALLGPATAALAGAVRAGALGRLTVERADGGGVYDSPLAQALEAAGFRPTPRGLRLRG